MSWLKNAVEKVRSKGEELKQSQALKTIQRKGSNLVSNAKRVVAKSSTGGANAFDLQAQLETRAKGARTPAAITELHKSWVLCLGGKEGYRLEDEDHILGFKEVLLRSRALEFTLDAIAAEPALRKLFCQPAVPEDKASPQAQLATILSKTLVCSAELAIEVVRASTDEAGVWMEGYGAWLMGFVTALKLDWKEECLANERRELALRAEYLRQEIRQLQDVQAPSGDDFGSRDRRRVDLSAELLQTYRDVKANLEAAQESREQANAERVASLKKLSEDISLRLVGLQSEVGLAVEKHATLEGEMNETAESLQAQMAGLSEKSPGLEQELNELEDRKLKLRMELDKVSYDLEEARVRQREHLEKVDSVRQELEDIKLSFREKLDAEDQKERCGIEQQKVIESTKQLVRDADAAVQSGLGAQLEELKRKQAQFKEHFQGLIKEHLTYADAQAKALRARADRCGVLGGDEAERLRVFEAAEAAKKAFEAFRSGQLEGTEVPETGSEVEAMTVEIEADLTTVLEMLGPLMAVERSEASSVLEPQAVASEEQAPASEAFAPPPRSGEAAAPEAPASAVAPAPAAAAEVLAAVVETIAPAAAAAPADAGTPVEVAANSVETVAPPGGATPADAATGSEIIPSAAEPSEAAA